MKVFQNIETGEIITTHDKFGQELPDPTPMAPPVGYVRQPSLAEQIRNMVRSQHLAMVAESQGFETFEEADDLDIPDDVDPSSPWEEVYEPPLPPGNITPLEEAISQAKARQPAQSPPEPLSAGGASPPAPTSPPPEGGA
ncbi:hypothetical protein [Apis mellifera associated microvirus 38]|nr:hypothetical protein [Apis mellifera associated microvirus 38]